jgi:hypothetical protein
MASIRRQGTRHEIRECRSTERGPRQYTLASFEGVLSPEALDAAESRARRPFSRDDVIEKARAKGIPVTRRRRNPDARRLLAHLQAGGVLDPRLVGLLRSALDSLRSEPVPPHLREAAEWLGVSESERGHALRGLLRTADKILHSRGALRERPRRPFPRFRSRAQES